MYRILRFFAADYTDYTPFSIFPMYKNIYIIIYLLSIRHFHILQQRSAQYVGHHRNTYIPTIRLYTSLYAILFVYGIPIYIRCLYIFSTYSENDFSFSIQIFFFAKKCTVFLQLIYAATHQ